MKLIPISIFLLLFVATNCFAHQTPSWSPEHIKEIRLTNQTNEVRIIKDNNDIDIFAHCLSRADTIEKVTLWSFIFGSSKYKEGKFKFNAKFSVIGDEPESGSWMYDSEQGVFSYLDPFIQSVYKLNGKDRAVINRFFETKQCRQRTTNQLSRPR